MQVSFCVGLTFRLCCFLGSGRLSSESSSRISEQQDLRGREQSCQRLVGTGDSDRRSGGVLLESSCRYRRISGASSRRSSSIFEDPARSLLSFWGPWGPFGLPSREPFASGVRWAGIEHRLSVDVEVAVISSLELRAVSADRGRIPMGEACRRERVDRCDRLDAPA